MSGPWLNGKQRPEYVGKLLFHDHFIGVVKEAVESEGRIYCQYVYNDGEYDYIYFDDQLAIGLVIYC